MIWLLYVDASGAAAFAVGLAVNVVARHLSGPARRGR